MPKDDSIKVSDVIRQLGKSIYEVDVLRSELDRDTPERKRLDNIRDDLDGAQRKLVRGRLAGSTHEFQQRAVSLRTESKKVLKAIKDVEELAKTLQALVKLVAAAQKLVEIFT